MNDSSGARSEPSPFSPALRRRNRLILVGLTLLGMLPLLGAVWLYYGAPSLIEGASTNAGALLDPPAQFEELGLREAGGAPLLLDEQRIWRLLLVPVQACDDACLEQSFLLRQTQVLLGRDNDRVTRLLVVPPEAATRVADQMAERDLGLQVVSAPAGFLSELLSSRTLRGGEPAAQPANPPAGGIVVVDPLGNVIFYFGLEQVGGELMGDLKLLLRLSNIG